MGWGRRSSRPGLWKLQLSSRALLKARVTLRAGTPSRPLLTCQCPCSWLLTHQTLGAQADGLALLLLSPSTPDAQ